MQKLLLTLLFLCSLRIYASGRVVIVVDRSLDPPARHGLTVLEQALKAKGFSIAEQSSPRTPADAAFVVLAGLNCPSVSVPQSKEALAIRRTTYRGKPAVILCGSD